MRSSPPDTSREPCPDRILDDIGGAFAMGAVGGSMYHFVRGMNNSPNGERIFGGGQAVGMNAPHIGGGFAVWGGLFSTFDCSMVYLHQKEDQWNSIAAGARFIQMRQGLRFASRSALYGGVLLALLEGGLIMLHRAMDGILVGDDLPPGPQETAAPAPATTSSWFGGKAEKEAKISGESFESPPPPNFEFK